MTLLRAMPNSELLHATSRLATEERRITLAVLEHFREIERRKAYSDLGYRSLFEYAVTHLRYSEGSASRRISAMIALRENPELGERIRSGQITVTNVAKIHTTLRRDGKISGKKWDSVQKREIFKELASLPAKELEQKLIVLAPEGTVQERSRPISENLYEVKIYLTADEFGALQELMGWSGHGSVNPGSYSDAIKKLIHLGRDEYLKRFKTPLRTRRDASPLVGESGRRSYSVTHNVPAETRRLVFTRAGFRCQQISRDGTRCDSRHFLQIEHIHPRGKGGSHALTNLELLCRAHNQIRGIRAFGFRQMQRE